MTFIKSKILLGWVDDVLQNGLVVLKIVIGHKVEPVFHNGKHVADFKSGVADVVLLVLRRQQAETVILDFFVVNFPSE
jgi:hypothetical protein